MFNFKPRQFSVTKLLQAHKKIEKHFLVDSTFEALSAKSGTKSYGFENIVGVGISEKMSWNRLTGQDAITVYVVAKVSKNKIQKSALVPEKINGIPTDVVETGEINALAYTGRYRPAPGGVSVGHYQISAGTLGCLVQKNGQTFILSNNHVLANSNAASINDPILQPGSFDGGNTSNSIVGRLSEFIPIQFGDTPNLVDCAIAKASSPIVTSKNIDFGKINSSPVVASRFMLVKKSGRTTQLTRGMITDVNATIRVGYGTSGKALFQDQIMITSIPLLPFSQGGDSGSLILTNSDNKPVGLLFAGSNLFTVANKIQNVLSSLHVNIYA